MRGSAKSAAPVCGYIVHVRTCGSVESPVEDHASALRVVYVGSHYYSCPKWAGQRFGTEPFRVIEGASENAIRSCATDGPSQCIKWAPEFENISHYLMKKTSCCSESVVSWAGARVRRFRLCSMNSAYSVISFKRFSIREAIRFWLASNSHLTDQEKKDLGLS